MDDGIRRRLKLVPFKYTVAPQDRDPMLAEMIAAEEGPAVLAWLVEGARRFYANGQRFTECEEIEEETREYLEEEDILGGWLEENVIKTPGVSTSLPDLYNSAAQYASSAGVRIPTKNDVSRRLKDEGYEPRRSKVYGGKVYVFDGITVVRRPDPGS